MRRTLKRDVRNKISRKRRVIFRRCTKFQPNSPTGSACQRRMRQIEAGSLRAENGLQQEMK